jgi:hypothetical protein
MLGNTQFDWMIDGYPLKRDREIGSDRKWYNL